MATYSELAALVADNQALRAKVLVAVIIKAEDILGEVTPTADRLAWASSALASPSAVTDELYHYVLAANSGATVTNILGATDAAIQANVDTAVNALHP